MKIFKKSLLNYLKDSGIFIAISLTIMILLTILRLLESSNPAIQSIVSIIGIIIIIWTGFRTIKVHGYKLIQTGFVGVLISLTTIWALPIFHSLIEVIYIAIINVCIYVILAIMGGIFAKAFIKQSNNR